MPPLLARVGRRPLLPRAGGRGNISAPTAPTTTSSRRPACCCWRTSGAARSPLLRNGSAALWDIGDGVVCFEFTAKMNALDDQGSSSCLARPIAHGEQERFKALVHLQREPRTSRAGANLGLALFAANIAAWGEIEKLVAAGQQAYKAMKYAPFPVVAAPSGMALGGGCEIVLHADAVQAHAETYIGLVECGVGLVPGWGGCGEMLARWRRARAAARARCRRRREGVREDRHRRPSRNRPRRRWSCSSCAPTDGITMNRDRLLADAKARALVAGGGLPAARSRRSSACPAPSGRVAMRMAAAGISAGAAWPRAHDLVVAEALAEVLSGGDADIIDVVTRKALLDLGARAPSCVWSVPRPRSARIEHTLETGKPLRN